jgi:hypothetical protein
LVALVEDTMKFNPLVGQGYLTTHVLIRLEEKGDSLVHDEDVRCFMRVMKDLKLIEEPMPQAKDFHSVGFVYVNGLDIPKHVAV